MLSRFPNFRSSDGSALERKLLERGSGNGLRNSARRDFHCACIKKGRRRNDVPVERRCCNCEGTNACGRRLGRLHHRSRRQALLSFRFRKTVVVRRCRPVLALALAVPTGIEAPAFCRTRSFDPNRYRPRIARGAGFRWKALWLIGAGLREKVVLSPDDEFDREPPNRCDTAAGDIKIIYFLG
jgi:hypothetical protein